MTGTLYGLGIGPGDPDLITLKALRLLRAAPVLAYPAPEGGESLARAIVAPHLPGTQVEVPIPIPMRPDPMPAQDAYDRAAAELSPHLDAGRDVAVLCEGDPFFYGSFMYLFARMAARHRVEVVPGVSSLAACAAAVGRPLSARNDALAILPAPMPAEDLRARIEAADAAAIMKLGRHFAKVRAVLDELGLVGRARYVERATLPNQRILPLDAVDPTEVPYFSMILVHKRGEVWS
jgi:precorrin-2/cobalt-factor-2 C20-methyltransferase